MLRSLSASLRPAASFKLFIDELAFRLSRSRRIDGLWVGCFLVEDHPQAFERVEAALDLIKKYDPVRYRRVLRDVERIWVNLVIGGLGQFRHSVRCCDLDERFVLADTTSPEQIAAAIVHEATHARLMRRGIGYEAELRVRVEGVCFRRELAFATKLPSGEQIYDEGERRLVGYPADYWTEEAFRDRFDKEGAEALRYLGAPELVIRAALRVRALLEGARRFTQRLKRFVGRKP